MQSVVALVGARVAAFELGIACQVFGLDRSDDGLPVHDFAVCGPRPGRVPTTSGFDVDVAHDLERVAVADLVVIPAWPTLDDPMPPGVADAITAAYDSGAIVLSICSGAFPLAAAGLLDGLRATTHWQFADLLARRYPAVHVDPDVLYVDQGRIVTGAGAAAGVDACLHLVRRELGATTATALARRMVVPAHRSGGQAQYVELPVIEPASAGGDLSALLDWVQEHLDQPLTAQLMADQAHLSLRTFARRFKEAVGTTPHRWLLDQRLQRAEELLERTELTVDAVAARSGFGSADTLRHHFTARRGVSPAEHRRTFAS